VLSSVLDPDLRNREGHREFDAVSAWRGPLRTGLTIVLRVKNEALNLPWVLPPLLRAAEEVILVDNESVDGTCDVAREIAEEHCLARRLRVVSYPFAVSRCGPEHLMTPPDSVHSLAYFNNWAFSHVRTTMAMKWDGDMVLTPDGEVMLGNLGWQVGRRQVAIQIPRHPVYLESPSVAYVDLGWHNVEHFGHPVAPGYLHVKAFEWEVLTFPDTAVHLRLPPGIVIEIKRLGAEEFAHWTDTDAFATSTRTARKRHEFQMFRLLKEQDWQSAPGVVRVEAPEGIHVLDHIAREWLPRAPRPLVRMDDQRRG